MSHITKEEILGKIKNGTFELSDAKRTAEKLTSDTIKRMRAHDPARYTYAWISETKLQIYRNGKAEWITEIGEREGATNEN